MRRILIALGVTGAMFFAAAPASCNSQLFNLLAVLCPDCYAEYRATHPGQ